ncbi:hypothetical protein [Luteococcus sp.]|uniref:hypothetical protein n=1 Tax=Luteococcus sp. TaxID=1969402 RepID=UPI00373602C9
MNSVPGAAPVPAGRLGGKIPALAHLALFVLWAVLWRLPVLMGDDRFFAVASGLPGGDQSLHGAWRMLMDCLQVYNGRWVDGIGAALFALGDTGIRLLMAALQVALTALLWAWVKASRELAAQPGAPAVASQGWDWTVWALLAGVPFVLVATNLGNAGESVFLMAATWNYVLPLDLLLLALLPVVRSLVSAGRLEGWHRAGLVLLPLAVSSHELVMVLGIVMVGVLVLADSGRRAHRQLWGQVGLAVGLGALAKLSTPGLWARASNYADQGADGLGPVRQKLASAALSASSVALHDAAVLVLLLVCLALCGVSLQGAGRTRRLAARRLLVAALACLLSWFVLSVVVASGPVMLELHPKVLDGLDPALCTAVVLSSLGFWAAVTALALVLGVRRWGVLGCAGVAGAAACFALGLLGASPWYALVHRTFFLSLLLAVVAAVAGLAQQQGAAVSAAWVLPARQLLMAAAALLAAQGLFISGLQLAANRAYWRTVEAQVVQARAGRAEVVTIAEHLPCPGVTWYFDSGNPTRARAQWRTYYGLPATVEIVPGPAPSNCPAPG